MNLTIYLIFLLNLALLLKCQESLGPLIVFYGETTYLPRDQDNVIRILFPAQLAGGPSLMPAICMCLRVWEDKINTNGGILVNGTVWNVSIIMVDVSAIGAGSVAQVNNRIRNVTGESIKPYPFGAYGRVDFILSPYSSTFSAACLQVADPAKMIVVSGTTGTTDIYRCYADPVTGVLPPECVGKKTGSRRFRYHVGIRGLVNNYWPSFLVAMKIKSAKTIGVYYEDLSLGYSCVQGVRDLAESLQLEITYEKKIPNIQNANISVAYDTMKVVVDELRAMDPSPDVILACGFRPQCEQFINYSAQVLYSPKAFNSPVCVDAALINTFGPALEYFSGSVAWDQRVKGPGYSENPAADNCVFWPPTANLSSALRFYYEVLNDTKINPTGIEPVDQAVATMVSCYVIHQGLLNAQTFEPDALMAAIDKLQIANTIYGPITFDNAGANSAKEYLAVQMVNVATTTRKSGVIIKRANDQTGITIEIITPAAAATVDSVFPLPSWSERVYINNYLKTSAEKGVIAVNSFLFLLTLGLMVFIVFVRNTPQIKAASFIFCEVILFGALLIYASLYFWVIFTNSVFCNLENWLFIFGVDIFLGGLLVKNLRLFYIFKNAMKLRKVNPLENWHLFLMIGGLMLVDAIVIIIWEAVFPIKAYRFTSIPTKPSFDYTLCQSQITNTTAVAADIYQTAFLATLGALKAVLLIVGVLLSIAVRKQPSEFNESTTIALAIYNISFCLICLLAIWLAIPDDNYTLKYILRTFIVLWGNTISIVVIFGRKLYYIAIGKDKPFKGRGTSSTSQIKSHDTNSRRVANHDNSAS